MSLKLSAVAPVLSSLSLLAAAAVTACGAPVDSGTSDVAATHGAAETELETLPIPPEPPIPILFDAGPDAAPVVPPPGRFACGPLLSCDVDTQYCQHILGGAVTPVGVVQPWRFSCVDLPSACLDDVECSCLPRFAARFCSAGPTGGLTVTELVPGPGPIPVPTN